jgi:hypothetical protein
MCDITQRHLYQKRQYGVRIRLEFHDALNTQATVEQWLKILFR